MINLARGQLASMKCEELAWQPSAFASGVFVRNLAVCGDLEMQIVRFEPGARFPVHTHKLPEFIYVLEGEVWIAGRRLGPGWASVAAAGSVHADVHSETGCTFVLVDSAG